MSQQLPQITRLFSAGTLLRWSEYVCWILLVLFFGINILGTYSQPGVRTMLTQALTSMNDTRTYLTLVNLFMANGKSTAAQNELTLAKDTAHTPQQKIMISTWRSQPLTLEKEFQYWKTTTDQLPNYRDAYIMAAAKAYDLGKFSTAKIFITHAFSIDPNNPTVIAYQKLIHD
jgi:hypothetical protein